MLTKKTIKYIQSLSHKKFREQHNAFIAETPKVVEELLRSRRFAPEYIVAVQEWIEQNNKLFNPDPEKVIAVPKNDLAKISLLKTPHDVLAVFKIPENKLPENINDHLILLLDDLQDPGNVGTIIRIADWFGVNNIFCSRHTANIYNPKVVQATMGSLAHVHVFYTDLTEFIKQQNRIILAATLDGIPVSKISSDSKAALIIGNEANGISAQLCDIAHRKITIPKAGKAESLNAAIATGILLSHLTGVS